MKLPRVAENTQWNGTNILDGARTQTTFQIGANASQTIAVNFGDLSANDTTATITSNTVLTLGQAPAVGDVLTFTG